MATRKYTSQQNDQKTNSGTRAQDLKVDFEKNLSNYYERLFRGVSRLTHDKLEAEGITQATLLKFLRIMTQKDWTADIKDINTYLMTIAKNLWNTRKRKNAQSPVSYDEVETVEMLDRSAVRDETTDLEKRIYLEELVKTLPWEFMFSGLTNYERQLFSLRKIEENSIEEIATIVGKDPSRVRYDLQKISARIRYRARKYLESADKEMLAAWNELHAKRDKVRS